MANAGTTESRGNESKANKEKMNRRKFLQNTAVVAAGSAAWSGRALSYERILGANDRISLGHIGVGVRGTELEGMVAELKDKKNAEVTAVCDLWSHNREQAVAANKKYYGKAPRALQHPERRAHTYRFVVDDWRSLAR